MQLTLCRLSALAALRALRARGANVARLSRRDLLDPDPAPRRRWSRSALSFGELGVAAGLPGKRPVDVAVSGPVVRLQTRAARNTYYSAGLPEGAFLDVGEGVAISSPELLFVELGRDMDFAVQVLVGHELCGSFARDARDPRSGEAAFDLAPATSVGRIASFLDACHDVKGVPRARQALAFVSDNAWSPAEAIVATMLSLPVDRLGYGLGPLVLNGRVDVAEGERSHRVPDISFVGTDVGLNYDGRDHLDLGRIVDAAGAGDARNVALQVRRKAVDDNRRDRELAAAGVTVPRVTAEDLYEDGGLDVVVAQVVRMLGRSSTRNTLPAQTSLKSEGIRRLRQELLWSLLPGERGEQAARALRERSRTALARATVTDVELVL